MWCVILTNGKKRYFSDYFAALDFIWSMPEKDIFALIEDETEEEYN